MAKYWVANNPNSEINDAKAQKLAELSATTATLAELNSVAGSAATAAERDVLMQQYRMYQLLDKSML